MAYVTAYRTGRSQRVVVEGVDELLDALKDFDTRLRKNAVRRGFKRAGGFVQQVMRANAASSRDTGTLQSGITYQVRKSKSKNSYYLLVGPQDKLTIIGKRRMNPRYYAHLVEGGTKPHSLKAKTNLGRSALAKVLANVVNRVREATDTKSHPGARAKPFIEPTFRETHDYISEVMFDELKKTLDRAVRKKTRARKM